MLRDEGRLKTLGEPTSKDVVREENAKIARKRVREEDKNTWKQQAEGRGCVEEHTNEEREERAKVFRHELANLRIQRLELAQRDADRATLQAMDAAIRQREQQLDKALYHRWWERPPPVPCKRLCGHVHGSVLRECCKAGSSAEEAKRFAEQLRSANSPVKTYFSFLR
jgi:hypothetical protein